jgi:hypothetical protein
LSFEDEKTGRVTVKLDEQGVPQGKEVERDQEAV